MTRVLPRSVDATVTQHSFEGVAGHVTQFAKYVQKRRPLPAGFSPGLTRRGARR